MTDRSQARPLGEEEPPGWRTPLIIVVVILAAVALALALATLLGGGDQDSGASPSASVAASTAASAAPSGPASAAASAVSSAAGSAAPSSAPSAEAGPDPVVPPPDGVIPPGSLARVTADGLRVREGPTTSAGEVATLVAGDLVAIGNSYLSPNI